MSEPSPEAAAAAIRGRMGGFVPRAGLVLGSGLGAIADAMAGPTIIPYAEIPGFPVPAVEGHAGRLVLGHIGGLPIACLQGRVHLYEGARQAHIRLLVRSLKLIGCSVLVLTNAAGSLRTDMPSGSLMAIADHINLQGSNPLVGPNDPAFGPRFPVLDDAYDAGLRGLLERAAADGGIVLHSGVYAACLGPSFETPAEIRAFARLGADAVGMSTVPEAIVARHCGMRVAAISVIANAAAGLGGEAPSHEQTLAQATRAAGELASLLRAFFALLADAA